MDSQHRLHCVWGLRYIDELVLRDRDTDGNHSLDERLYAADDANFDVVSILDTTGTKVDSWGYTPYGYPMHDSWGQLDSTTGFTTNNTYAWHIGHQGLYHDDILELVYNRARTYYPLMGRFMQRDPVGYVDGLNVFLKAAGNPVRNVDPQGTSVLSDVLWRRGPDGRYYIRPFLRPIYELL